MLKMEPLKDNIVKVNVPQKLSAEDFAQFAPQADAFIRKYGNIRLLVDARDFDGWQDMQAFEKHMGFVKSHQKKVERIALIAGHGWHHWLAGVFRLFAHPEISVYDSGEEAKALKWLEEKGQIAA